MVAVSMMGDRDIGDLFNGDRLSGDLVNGDLLSGDLVSGDFGRAIGDVHISFKLALWMDSSELNGAANGNLRVCWICMGDVDAFCDLVTGDLDDNGDK